MNYFIYTYIISLLTGRYELNKLTSLPMCGFIAQLVEHRTGIAEVTGSNPVEALIFFFQASSFQFLKLENSLRGSFFTFADMNIGFQKATEIKKTNSKEENIVFLHGSFFFQVMGPLFFTALLLSRNQFIR